MKRFFRSLLLLTLCHMAHVAQCQLLALSERTITIPGLGMFIGGRAVTSNTFAMPANPDAPHVEGRAYGADTVPHSVYADMRLVATDSIPADQGTSISAFEDIPDPLIRKYAEMISLDVTDIDNYPLYKFIDTWYGVRYKYGGKDRKGIDCSALSQKLYGSVFGVEIKRTARQQHKQCEKVRRMKDAEEGDLVFFKMNRVRVSHVGVFLANGYFLHASKSKGVMISSLDSKYWHRRYAGCGRLERENKAGFESDVLQ